MIFGANHTRGSQYTASHNGCWEREGEREREGGEREREGGREGGEGGREEGPYLYEHCKHTTILTVPGHQHPKGLHYKSSRVYCTEQYHRLSCKHRLVQKVNYKSNCTPNWRLPR